MIILNEAARLISPNDLNTYSNIYGLLAKTVRISEYEFHYSFNSLVVDYRRDYMASLKNQNQKWSSFNVRQPLDFSPNNKSGDSKWIKSCFITFKPNAVSVDIVSRKPMFGHGPDEEFENSFTFVPVVKLQIGKARDRVGSPIVSIKLESPKTIPLKDGKLFFNSVNIGFTVPTR